MFTGRVATLANESLRNSQSTRKTRYKSFMGENSNGQNS